MAKTVETVPYSFDDLYKESKALFNDSGFDVSEGSNTAQLSAVMSYLVSTLNTNTAMNINETLLPYATKRKNVLQDARVLGYEAQHVISYQYRLTIRLSYDLIGYGKITIPKYSKFTNANHTYVFLTNVNDISTTTANGIIVDTGNFKVKDVIYSPKELTFEFDTNTGYIKTAKTKTGLYVDNLKEVNKLFQENRDISFTVKEGEIVDYNLDPSALEVTVGSVTVNGNTYTRNYIDIPYTNVENDGIDCYVSYYDDYGNYQEKIPYTRTDDFFFEKDANTTNMVKHKFIRIDDIEMGTPRIYFKYAGLGKGVPFGSVVQLCILQSDGEDGKMQNLASSKNVFSLPNYNFMYSRAQTDAEKQIADNTTPQTEELNVITGITLPTITSGNENSNFYINDIFASAKVLNCELLTSGTSEESTNSVIVNAPKVYNSANRLVTCLDYKYACNRSSFVLDSAVWGGEDEFPKAPGHIWFSFLPNKISERGFTSDENKTEYIRNNSELVYNYAEGESVYQHQMRQEYYQRNYLLNTEIKSYNAFINENGTIVRKYGGVWGDLVNKYVPSLTFHHRHPIYMNFNYNIHILKYNIKETTESVHESLFNALDACFYGDDSLNLENYETEYFHTNIVKRLDYLLSDLCGFTSDLETQLVLNEKTLCTENWKSEYKDIYIPLCVPYEKYYTDEGFLDTSRLPNIDTKNFINFTYDIIRDPLGIYGTYTNSSNTAYSSYDGQYISKYSDVNSLRYSLVTGDLFVDWSVIKANTEKNKELYYTMNDGKDYTDLSTKMFIAPIKIKMKYRYLITQDFINRYNANEFVEIQLGFNLAPENKKDESFNNIKYTLYKNNDSNVVVYNNSQLQPIMTRDLTDRSKIRMYTKLHLQYVVDKDNMPIMENSNLNNVLEIEFERTCGYYYLFNTFKKEILIHLFVNGDYEGFTIAQNGVRSNKYYDVHLEEVASTFKVNESQVYDDTAFSDITYSNPIAYLTTSDRKFITCDDASEDGIHHDWSDLPKKAQTILDSYIPVNGKSNLRYITTEGYVIDTLEDVSDVDYYTGEVVRDYNESMYEYTPLTVDMFRQNVYMNVKYPSLNFKVLRNVIPRLNNVKFKNSTETY